MVRKERLELSQVTLLEPKSSASTNSATFAYRNNTKTIKMLIIKHFILFYRYGGLCWDRTNDLLIKSQLLFQLSYVHHSLKQTTTCSLLAKHSRLARLTGFEPVTPGLEGRCSIRLSYRR